MKVTYSWLKDFVEVKISPEALAQKLTMAGLEVTSLEEKCGDFVFEIEITSNRPDWLSVIGIAREVAAITGKELKFIRPPSQKPKAKSQKPEAHGLRLEIENKKDCPLYTAKIIKDVKVGPSPDWLKKRLELIGCRSINSVVDITNYILFEYGEPLHAFDLDKMGADAIIVRRAKNGEKITLIDGQEKTLSPDILVIADNKKPLACAGIMGGKDTEVTQGTKNVLLEAALFNPVVVRRSRQALGLQSESAYRFERGVDLDTAARASLAAVGLIENIAQGRCVFAKSTTVLKTKRKNIALSSETIERVLGVSVKASRIKTILDTLGFKTKPKTKNSFSVKVPLYRQDINLEIDLVEDVARIYGFESIPVSLPAARPQTTLSDTRSLVSLTKNVLTALGLNEVITYSLVNRELLPAFEDEFAKMIEILNPLNREQGVLRSKLIPSLLGCLAYNLNQKQEYVNIFETAKSFFGPPESPKEELSLGIAICGARPLLLEQGTVKDEPGLLHLKGILEVLFVRLGVEDYDFKTEGSPWAIALFVRQKKIGQMQKLSKETLARLDIKNKEVFTLELSLEKLFSFCAQEKKYIPIPKYPAVTRDISFILKEDIPVKTILEKIKEKGRPFLSSIKVVDYYKGKQIPSGYRGLTISCVYLSKEGTLLEAQINPVQKLINDTLLEDFGAKIR